jgi:hypothetical protein
MAGGVDAEQTLKTLLFEPDPYRKTGNQFSGSCCWIRLDIRIIRRFPVGRTAAPWQIAHHIKCRLARRFSRTSRFAKRGERVTHVANVAIATAADQIAHRRHPARDQRQFPRTI